MTPRQLLEEARLKELEEQKSRTAKGKHGF